MGGVAFEHLTLVVLFLFAVWLLGRVFKMAKLPAVLGEFMAGLMLGPNCFDLVPFASDGNCPDIDLRRRSLSELPSMAGRLLAGGGGEDDEFVSGCFRIYHTDDTRIVSFARRGRRTRGTNGTKTFVWVVARWTLL